MAVIMTKEQQEQEKKSLKDNGYYWRKSERGWALYDPCGNVVEKSQALHAIATNTVPKAEPTFDHAHRLAAITWARAVAMMDPVFLDTETTGTGEGDVVVQIGVCDLHGAVLLDSLVHNHGIPISEKAQETHGISEDMLASAPTFGEVWETLQPILAHRTVVIYNSVFDTRLLTQTAHHHELVMPMVRAHCLMRQYALFHGMTKPSTGEFVNQRLERACEQLGVTLGNAHNALADAEAARRVLVKMAEWV